jgi:hypothetical protein
MRSATSCCGAIAFSFTRVNREAIGIARFDASSRSGSQCGRDASSRRDRDAGSEYERDASTHAGSQPGRDASSRHDRDAGSEYDRDAGSEYDSETVSAGSNSRPPIL